VEFRDLFGALPGSYGTLGIILCAEIECIDAKPMVNLTITPFKSIDDGLQFMSKLCREKNSDFIEAIHYPSGTLAVISGALTDLNHINKSTESTYRPDNNAEQWFFEYVESKCKINTTHNFNLPIKTYLFRYDRGAFWMALPLRFQRSLRFILRNALLIPLFAMTHNNFISRALFRRFFTTRFLYSMLRKAHPEIVAQRMLIMDVRILLMKNKTQLSSIPYFNTGFRSLE